MGRERSAFHRGPEFVHSNQGRIHERRPTMSLSFFACNSAADHTWKDAPSLGHNPPFDRINLTASLICLCPPGSKLGPHELSRPVGRVAWREVEGDESSCPGGSIAVPACNSRISAKPARVFARACLLSRRIACSECADSGKTPDKRRSRTNAVRYERPLQIQRACRWQVGFDHPDAMLRV